MAYNAIEVTVSKDVPGFVSNALLMPFLNEVSPSLNLHISVIRSVIKYLNLTRVHQAILHLEKGIATRDDIDKTLRLGMGHPMGPLTLGT